MKILCVSIDLPGHLDWGGYLITARDLGAQGHDVRWASGPAIGAHVHAQGIPFIELGTSGWRHNMPPLPPGIDGEKRQQLRRERALDVWLNLDAVGQAFNELRSVSTEFFPDVILVEPYAAAGALLAEVLQVPFVVVGRPALPTSSGTGPASAAIDALCHYAGVSGQYWDRQRGSPRSPDLHIDFFCRNWYADLESVATQTVFCGGIPKVNRQEGDREQGQRPLVLVTLGSTFSDDELFFRLAAESIHMVGGRGLLVTGRHTHDLYQRLQVGKTPGSVVVDWVDYTDTFPGLAAIVHHGGMATTQAALVHGIPQVVVPHAGDQYPQAARVTQARVGYGIQPRDFTLANTPLIMADLVYDLEFRQNASRLATEMTVLGGIPTAAAAIARMVT